MPNALAFGPPPQFVISVNLRPMKKLVPLTIGIPVLGLLLFDIMFYGSLNGWLRRCEYTENIVSLPEALKNSVIILDTSDEYVARGQDPNHCTPLLHKPQNEIVSVETIDNLTVGKSYFTRQGRRVERLPYGKKFNLEKIVAETKHGLSAVDDEG